MDINFLNVVIKSFFLIIFTTYAYIKILNHRIESVFEKISLSFSVIVLL